jgi:hypothetical protein
MTPRTLFILVLRILGILSLKELVVAVPQLISTIVIFFGSYSVSGGLFMVLISLLTVALFISISYVLVYKADFLVTKFGLDQDIKEPFLQLTISVPSILRIVIIITGVLVLFLEIPEFCRIIYNLLQERNLRFLQDGSPDWSPAVFSGVKIVLGLLLIGERKRILQFLNKSADSEVKRLD